MKDKAVGAARVVLTMAVIGGAAGAVLAVATVPAFAPYHHGAPRAAPVVEAPVLEPESREPAYDLAPRAGPESPLGALDILPGIQDGTIVLEVPQWTRDGVEWMLFARRAMREWRDMAAPDDTDAQGYYHEDGRSGRREGWRHEPRYGYDAPQEDQPYGNSEEYYYHRPERPAVPIEPGFRPAPQVPPSAFERAFPAGPSGSGAAKRDIPEADSDDAAASAARRAREAAEDVLSAERTN